MLLVVVVYGGLNVLLGAFVLSGVIHPAGAVDRTALRWHVGVWDLWFLVWGILLALGTAGYWRRTATGVETHAAGRLLARSRNLRRSAESDDLRFGAATSLEMPAASPLCVPAVMEHSCPRRRCPRCLAHTLSQV